MKFAAALLLGALCLLAGRLSVAAAPRQAPPGMKQYFLGLIYKGDIWTAENSEEVMRMQQGHMANIGRLVESGELVLAGPCGDDGELRGLFLYDVPTREHAERLVQSDPAVAAGRLRVELHSWWGVDVIPELKRLMEEAEAERDGLHEEPEGER